MRIFSAALAIAASLSLCAAAPAGVDDEQDLKDRDPLVRLAAVERIASGGGEGAEKLLLKALKDEDWEVVERAASGLTTVGGDKSVSPLTALAWDGPVRCVRRAAAGALASIDAEAGLKGLAKKLSGDRAARVAEAYGIVALGGGSGDVPRALDKLLASKESTVRAAAARALVVADKLERAERLAELLESEHLAVVAAALEGAGLDPRPEQRAVLLAFLGQPRLADVVERRALLAAVLSAGALGAQAANAALFEDVAALSGAEPAAVAARGPRLAELAAGQPWFDPGPLVVSTAAARTHASAGPRAAVARTLRCGGPDLGLAPARELAATDPSPRVRRAGLASALALVDPDGDDGQRAWIIARLAAERDASVREELVTALALRDRADAAEALVAALGDPDWGVAVCAAVSLGRTRDGRAAAHLTPLAQNKSDWRLRGAALVGLYHALDPRAVPPLIEALTDPEPLVARTAHALLELINRGQPLAPDPELWRAWWDENEKRVRLEDPKEAQERAQRFGRSTSLVDVYAGLDLLVLESRGDHIQTVLEQLGIEFRLTWAGRLPESGLDATGVFISNCTGEMEGADVERLQWFVRVGGYLFGSCWAVHETIAKVAPGAVRRLDTLGEVMDRVRATPCAIGSPYLEGVFELGVVPIYQLEGAHLIEVLEPERVEVLVDSAECAERWGDGNLACWFRLGHGVILDSVNHFDLQGFARATELKKPEERMAFAVDHMGASFATIRETRGEKLWSSNNRAGEVVRDLSIFKLITNFVRLRRSQGL